MTANSEDKTNSSKPKKGFFGYAWRTIVWFLVILYFVLGAAWLGARYYLAPYLNEHKSSVERKISQVLDVPVQFGSLDTDWAGLSPEITLKNIELGEHGKDPITAESLTARLSLRSLTNLAPIFESVTLNKPKAEIRRIGPMTFSVLGKKVNLRKLMSSDTEVNEITTKLPPDVMLLLKQKLLEINDGTVLLHDQKSGNTLEIKDINAAFKGSSKDKQFAFTLTPPPEIASPITVRALLKTPALNPSKLGNWDADLYASTEFINFGELAKWLPDFSIKYKGIGSGSVWANFVKWSPSSASFIGALSDVDLQIPDTEPLQLKYVKGKISGNRSDKTYGISTEDFSFELNSGEKLPPLNMNLALNREGESGFSGGTFKANSVDFQSIAALLPSLPLPKNFKDFVAERKLSGSLDNVDISWKGQPQEPKHYNGTLSLNNFSSYGAAGKDNTQWLPGFINISGDVSMKDGVGTAVLKTKDAAVALPGIFPAAAFNLSNLSGSVVWNTNSGLSLEFQDVLIENDDAAVKVNGTYKTDETPFGTVDLRAVLLRGNVPAVWKYIPLVAGNDTITWLRHGLLAGAATGGSAVLKGALHNFPFKDEKDGSFLVSVDVDKVLLDVYPNILDNPKQNTKKGAIWPVFEDVGGVVKFQGDGMYITADRGTYKNVKLSQAKVNIPAFSDETVWLDVDASAAGPLPGFLSYVKASPVDGYTGGVFKKAEGSGDGTLNLGLKIPLDGPGDVAVKGSFTLDNDTVKFNDFSIPDLSKVTGTVNFSEKGADSTGLTADCFGTPVKATLNTNDKGDIKVTASGTISSKALPQVIPVPMLAKAAEGYLVGKAPFNAEVVVGSKNTTVDIKSSLVGLQSKLPAPMEKAASVSAPLHLTVQSDAKKTDLTIMIDRFLSSEFVLQNGEITRASIGNRTLPSLPAHGYAVSLKAPVVSAAAWDAVLNKINVDKTPSKGPVELPDIAYINANVDLLEIDNFNQTDLSMLARTIGNSLQATIKSNQLNANLEWKKGINGKEPELIAHISKLFIPSSAGDAAAKSKPVEIKGGWPAINAVVDDLTYGNMHLGKLELVARNTNASKGQLWKITKLNLTNPAASLKSSGSWLKTFSGGNETSLLFTTNISNFGNLLNRLDVKNIVSHGNGTIKGNLSWVGTPLGFNTQSFDGEIIVNLNKGEILKIQPGPAAKLLSLLTLQSLTRYLTLDFRDFYSSGFNFSTIRGDAKINNGLMAVKDLTMIGGSATVVINGDINTQKETENLHLLVLPDINAAGASVALAVANPIVGIGSFLAQLIFKDPLSKLFSFEYQVTGTWSDPVVKKVSSH